ncbi:MAG: hypothetical protein ACREQN_15010 [Candidatus Binataceae bacterium]
MRFTRLLGTGIVALLALAALIVTTTGIAIAQQVQWERIVGIQQGGDVVGSGTGQVTGGAPWETTRGSANVDLNSGEVRFFVQGLIIAVGSFAPLSGIPIGTPAGISEVKGTLVCNVDGSTNSGNSVLVDTPAVSLDTQGNAFFTGSFVSALPSSCGTASNDAFLIRIVQPTTFTNFWIAFGAVQNTGNHH